MSQDARSQTLSRGLRTLEVLAGAAAPLSIAEVAAELELHRSIAYRMLRTLEDHSLVSRDQLGRYRPGAGLAVLARSVARDLQSVSAPQLRRLADTLGITAFLVVQEGQECITLLAEEPLQPSVAAVAQRPGARHPLSQGAPGIALQSRFSEKEWERLGTGLPYREASHEARALGYAVSHDEVILGLRSVAALIPESSRPAAALAVVYLSSESSEHSEAEIGEQLRQAAMQIASRSG